MHVSYLVNLQSFVDNSAYNVSMNTIVDSLKIYTDRAVGKCIKLFLWVPWKPRNSQNLSVNFFLKRPVPDLLDKPDKFDIPDILDTGCFKKKFTLKFWLFLAFKARWDFSDKVKWELEPVSRLLACPQRRS